MRINLAPPVREMEKCMEKNEIVGYEPLVNELKQLIQKKQYHVLRIINSETINLYWKIGEEIYRQQQENGWGKSIVQVLSKELQKVLSPQRFLIVKATAPLLLESVRSWILLITASGYPSYIHHIIR